MYSTAKVKYTCRLHFALFDPVKLGQGWVKYVNRWRFRLKFSIVDTLLRFKTRARQRKVASKIEPNFALIDPLQSLGEGWAKYASEFFQVQPRTQSLIYFCRSGVLGQGCSSVKNSVKNKHV